MNKLFKKIAVALVAIIAVLMPFTAVSPAQAATDNYCVKYGYGDITGGVRCYGEYNKYHYYSAIVTCKPNLWWLGFSPFTKEGPRVRNGAMSSVFCGNMYYVGTIKVRH